MNRRLVTRSKFFWALLFAGTGFLLLCAGLWMALSNLDNAGKRPALAFVSALPLGWHGQDIGTVVQGKAQRSPLSTWLDHFYAVTPVEHITAEALAKDAVLLLAQPRRLSPQELVAIDGWVRAGGRALVLDDPELRWSTGQGDNGAPPASLLDPLMTHWGIRLELPPVDTPRANPPMPPGDGGGTGVGTWTVLQPTCRVSHNPAIGSCEIGQGRVDLVADADWVAPEYWYAGGNPLQPANHVSANAGALVDSIDRVAGVSSRGVAEEIGQQREWGFTLAGLGSLFLLIAGLLGVIATIGRRSGGDTNI